MRARVEHVAGSKAEVVRAGLLPNPVLSLSLGFPIAGAGGPTTIGASLVGDLASILTLGRRKGVAAAQLEQSVLELADAAVSLASEARAAHAHADFAGRAATFAEENAALVQRSLDLTERRVEAGEASKLDANRVRVLLLQARVEASQFRSESDTARRALLTIMGMPDGDASFSIAQVLPEAHQFEPPGETEVIALAVTRRLDVAAAMAAAEAAARSAGLAGVSWLGAEGGAAYERDDSGRDTLGPSVSMGIPIFDTGQARVAGARAEARSASHAAEYVRQSAIGQARTAWVRARTDADAAGRFAADIAQLADDNLELARLAYDAGEEDLTVLLETQRQRISSKIELLKLRERAVRSRIDLARAVGGSLDVTERSGAAVPTEPVNPPAQ